MTLRHRKSHDNNATRAGDLSGLLLCSRVVVKLLLFILYNKYKNNRFSPRLKIGMNEGSPPIIMAESNNLNGSQRRRSPRWSSSSPSGNKMALDAAVAVKRFTMRKITARKTAAPSEHNKENTPRRSEGSQQKKLKVSTPASAPDCGLSSAGKRIKKKAPMLSPILPADSSSSPPPESRPEQPAVDAEDAVWSQKVRRSYSRLSDKSFNSPDTKETLFGFGKLQTPEVSRRGELSKTALEVSASLSGLNSFTSLLEAADDCGSAVPELDTNIPGVAVVKEKKRRRRRKKEVQQINSEVDALVDLMNAEFEEAECFELTVE